MKQVIVFAFALSSLCSAHALTYEFKPSKGKVSFLAVGHPSAIKIRGEGSGAEGKLTETDGQLNGTLKFNLTTLKTGIDLRDKHVKEKYLEVSEYPDAQLTLNNLPAPKKIGVSDVPFEGTLSLRGVERPVKGTYSTESQGDEVKTVAKFPVEITEYKIETPSYLGITVADKVTVEITSTILKSETP